MHSFDSFQHPYHLLSRLGLVHICQCDYFWAAQGLGRQVETGKDSAFVFELNIVE